ncbi:hypothetical protein LCGC14_0383140 [marine sediment metagenome]|uniref:Uncharacterized protein n=1 Tax=marine sediment metagenome TaxID=412755 RepID=A0A0F9T1I6_9ZZZZ
MKRFTRVLLKQYDMGTWLGTLKNVFGKAMAYQTPINVLIQATTLFAVITLRPKQFGWLIGWLELWMFLVFLACMLLFFMLFVWKVELPSSFYYGNQ